MPDSEQVRLIFRDTYKFYDKWKNISNLDNWVVLMQEARDIDHMYNCDLCRQIILELVKCIEHEFKARRDSSD
jgi:hypothetical protein